MRKHFPTKANSRKYLDLFLLLLLIDFASANFPPKSSTKLEPTTDNFFSALTTAFHPLNLHFNEISRMAAPTDPSVLVT